MKTFNPSELTPRQRGQLINGTIGPRPVAFASTLDAEGRPNLAPFSYFNIFSSAPPVLIFSTNIRIRDNVEKDTLRNVRQTGEVVINLVDYNMVRQMAIAGIEYGEGINEFEKSGLTPLPAVMVKPLRVKESPAQYECKILEIKSLGTYQSSAHLIIAQAVLIHIRESAIDQDERIDPQQMDLVGRLGGINYCRAHGEAVFQIMQPHSQIAMGFDSLPLSIKTSPILTGNELALLAGVTTLPTEDMVKDFTKGKPFLTFWSSLPNDPKLKEFKIHGVVREYLLKQEIENAWMLILAMEALRKMD